MASGAGRCICAHVCATRHRHRGTLRPAPSNLACRWSMPRSNPAIGDGSSSRRGPGSSVATRDLPSALPSLQRVYRWHIWCVPPHCRVLQVFASESAISTAHRTLWKRNRANVLLPPRNNHTRPLDFILRRDHGTAGAPVSRSKPATKTRADRLKRTRCV